MQPLRVQPLLDAIGDAGLPGAGKAGEPDDQGRLMLDGRAVLPADRQGLRAHIVGAAQGETDHARPGGLGCLPVDQDEAAQFATPGIGLERHGRIERQGHQSDLVQTQRPSRQSLAAVHVHPVLQVADPGRGRRRTDAQLIGCLSPSSHGHFGRLKECVQIGLRIDNAQGFLGVG